MIPATFRLPGSLRICRNWNAGSNDQQILSRRSRRVGNWLELCWQQDISLGRWELENPGGWSLERFRQNVAFLDGFLGGWGDFFGDEDLFGGIWITETRKWIEDCDNALCFFLFPYDGEGSDMGRSWKIYKVWFKNNLMQLMLICWPVPTWGYVHHEALHPRIASLPGTKEASGGDHRLSMLWQGLQRFACAWSEICFFVTCFTSTDQVWHLFASILWVNDLEPYFVSVGHFVVLRHPMLACGHPNTT